MGKSATLNVTGSLQSILTAQSGKTLTVRTLAITNTGNFSAEVNVEFYRSGVGYNITSQSVIPAKKTTSVFLNKDLCIYLEEGDQLRISANQNGVVALCSYDEEGLEGSSSSSLAMSSSSSLAMSSSSSLAMSSSSSSVCSVPQAPTITSAIDNRNEEIGFSTVITVENGCLQDVNCPCVAKFYFDGNLVTPDRIGPSEEQPGSGLGNLVEGQFQFFVFGEGVQVTCVLENCCGQGAVSNSATVLYYLAASSSSSAAVSSSSQSGFSLTISGFNVSGAPVTETFVCPPDQYILDAAEEKTSLAIPFSCRSGACGTCIATQKSGTAANQEDQSFLDGEEIARGCVLTCSAYPTGDGTFEVPGECVQNSSSSVTSSSSASWSPGEVTSAALKDWWSADNPDNQTSGGVVTQMANKVQQSPGVPRNPLVGSGILRPTAANGLPAVAFLGTGQGFGADVSNQGSLVPYPARTVVCVLKMMITGFTSQVANLWALYDFENKYVGLNFPAASTISQIGTMKAGLATWTGSLPTTVQSPINTRRPSGGIVNYVVVSSAMPDTLQYNRANGFASATQANLSVANSSNFYLAKGSENTPVEFEVAEIMLFDDVLSNTDLNLVETWLSAKYNINMV